MTLPRPAPRTVSVLALAAVLGACAGTPATTAPDGIRPDASLYTVIFDFDVAPEQQGALAEEIQRLVRDIVRHQPGFVASHLHLSTDGEKVLNYFQWESREAFDAFRADEEQQRQIRPVIGPYGPTPRAYEVVFSAAPTR